MDDNPVKLKPGMLVRTVFGLSYVTSLPKCGGTLLMPLTPGSTTPARYPGHKYLYPLSRAERSDILNRDLTPKERETLVRRMIEEAL